MKKNILQHVYSIFLLASATDETEFWLSSAAKVNPCSLSPTVYQDLSTRPDWL